MELTIQDIRREIARALAPYRQLLPADEGAGSGDVTGPASSTQYRIVVFSDATGKVIEESTTTTLEGYRLAMLGAQTGDFILDMGGAPVAGYALFCQGGFRFESTSSILGDLDVEGDISCETLTERATGDGITMDAVLFMGGNYFYLDADGDTGFAAVVDDINVIVVAGAGIGNFTAAGLTMGVVNAPVFGATGLDLSTQDIVNAGDITAGGTISAPVMTISMELNMNGQLGSNMDCGTKDLTNLESLAFTGVGTLDLEGSELILDVDGDTSITADTDDKIDFRTGGVDQMYLQDDGLHFTGSEWLWCKLGGGVTYDDDGDTYHYCTVDDRFYFVVGGQIVSLVRNLTMRYYTPQWFRGMELCLDADNDTSITADTDDEIDFKAGGVDRMTLTNTKLNMGVAIDLNGLNLDSPGNIDAKGDLMVGTANNNWVRLPVGSDGDHLVCDSGEASGLKWEAP